jgi:hypothetical protein
MPQEDNPVANILSGDAGEKEAITFYLDKHTCRKLEALSVFKFETPTGGRDMIVSKLIRSEFDELTEEGVPLEGFLEEHLRHEARMSKLRTEGGDAQSDSG